MPTQALDNAFLQLGAWLAGMPSSGDDATIDRVHIRTVTALYPYMGYSDITVIYQRNSVTVIYHCYHV